MTFFYVYVLKSISHPNQIYTGFTEDLNKRLSDHDAGRARHTSKYAPWQCLVALRFPTKHKALEFERYLKTGSGRAFLKRHFLLSDD